MKDAAPRKNGANTGRDARGRFGAGNPGKPRGARHKSSLAVEMLLEGEAEALTRKAIELAKAGDTTALRLCLERIAPPSKDRPLSLCLPEIHAAADTARATGAVLQAVASGELTPGEATAVMALIESHRRALETGELEARLAAMEENLETSR